MNLPKIRLEVNYNGEWMEYTQVDMMIAYLTSQGYNVEIIKPKKE